MTERYTHGHDDAVLRSHSWRTAENSARHLLEVLEPGASVLDVGCGPGTITADLARAVGDGQVLGLDRSAEVVARAASTWCFTSEEDRGWWARTWADRITGTDLADQAIELGVADRDLLERCGVADLGFRSSGLHRRPAR